MLDWQLILNIFVAVVVGGIAKEFLIDLMTRGGMVENIHNQLKDIEKILREMLGDSRGQY